MLLPARPLAIAMTTQTVRTTRRSARVAAAAAAGSELADVSVGVPTCVNIEEGTPTTPKKPAKRRKMSASDASVKEEAGPTPKKPKAGKKDGTIPPLTRHTPPPAVHLPTALAHLSAADPRFSKLSERVPCRPFLGPDGRHGHKEDPFRSLVTSIIGQQVSWMAARSITKRFIEHFCGAVDGEERGDWPFPTPEQVAISNIADLKGVGFSTRKSEYG